MSGQTIGKAGLAAMRRMGAGIGDATASAAHTSEEEFSDRG